MVLVPGGSGFQTYEGSNSLLAFSSRSPVVEQSTSAPATPRAIVPRAEILTAIHDTGLRYAGHPGVRRAGLSSMEWVRFFQANIEIESAYNPRAQSHVGAYGLGQLMPATARQLGVDHRDMAQNLDGSARYLAMQLEKFGSMDLALAAYNAGPHRVVEYGGIPPFTETQNHVRKVTAVYRRLSN